MSSGDLVSGERAEAGDEEGAVAERWDWICERRWFARGGQLLGQRGWTEMITLRHGGSCGFRDVRVKVRYDTRSGSVSLRWNARYNRFVRD